jgi:hypothetical protein
MCLLTFLPAEVMPDLDALANGAELNADGHGFAIVTGDQILLGHGMNADTMIDAFDAARRDHPDGPALFHSRFSTHGTVDLDNCHPFTLGRDRRTVLAHNGVLPKAVQPGPGDPRSDTRIAAQSFLPAFGSLRSSRGRRRLQRWMTRDNKMVILTVDRRFRDRAYILNEDAGVWDQGIWYSNDGFRPWPPRRFGSGAWWWPATGKRPCALLECSFCQALTDPAEAQCGVCRCCLDCGELPEQCFCYSPAALDRRPGA